MNVGLLVLLVSLLGSRRVVPGGTRVETDGALRERVSWLSAGEAATFSDAFCSFFFREFLWLGHHGDSISREDRLVGPAIIVESLHPCGDRAGFVECLWICSGDFHTKVVFEPLGESKDNVFFIDVRQDNSELTHMLDVVRDGSSLLGGEEFLSSVLFFIDRGEVFLHFLSEFFDILWPRFE